MKSLFNIMICFCLLFVGGGITGINPDQPPGVALTLDQLDLVDQNILAVDHSIQSVMVIEYNAVSEDYSFSIVSISDVAPILASGTTEYYNEDFTEYISNVSLVNSKPYTPGAYRKARDGIRCS